MHEGPTTITVLKEEVQGGSSLTSLILCLVHPPPRDKPPRNPVVQTCPWGAKGHRLKHVLLLPENVSFTEFGIFRTAQGLFWAGASAQMGKQMPWAPGRSRSHLSITKPQGKTSIVSRQLSWLQIPWVWGGVEHPGPHLVRVVKAVIHEPRDQRRLPNCKTIRREGFSHGV